MDETTLRVTELPVRKWTQDYKELLESLIKPEDKNEVPLLLDYKEHHTDANVDFVLSLNPAKAAELLGGDVYGRLKLTTKISCGVCVCLLCVCVCVFRLSRFLLCDTVHACTVHACLLMRNY